MSAPSNTTGYRWIAAVVALLVLLSAWEATAQDTAPAEGGKYKTRTYRIIVNDDGEIPIPGKDRTLEQFLAPKFNDVLGTQVDAMFLCLGSTDRHVPPERARVQDAMNQWAADGTIPEHLDKQIRTYIDAAHKAGIDIFLAVRMNDIHDAWAKKLSYPLKVKRPDLLIGKGKVHQNDVLMNAHWSGFDWSKPEVRKHFLDFILWCCKRFDFDGVELDWFRHPLFFKLGEEQANVENMNQFVRDVRKGLNEIATERGKPYLLTVRPMDTPAQCLWSGFDVEQWMKEGLLDMLMIGGGYLPYGARLKEFVDLAHQYGIPAYPCMNHFKDPEMMRTVASNFFALGGDGFYIFNWYGVEDGSEKAACLNQCGSPETLAGLDKKYVADNGCAIKYCGYVNPPGRFPVRLVGGKPIELVVGDDVEKAQKDGTIGRMTLTVKVTDMNHVASLKDAVAGAVSNERISIQVNGVQLADDAIGRVGAETFRAKVTAPPLRRGVNRIRVFPGPNCLGSLRSEVLSLELTVDYEPTKGEPAARKKSAAGPPPGQRVIKPASGVPLSLYGVKVGSKKSVVFELDVDPAQIKRARLALNAEDFDDPKELTITMNGGEPLTVPKELIADVGFQTGFVEVPLDQLRKGKNTVTFTFASNLGGTTRGFDVAEALLVLQVQ